MSGNSEQAGLDDLNIWYKDGLRFECQQCGDCCRIHGVVWVNSAEIAQMANFLGLGYSDFRRNYLREIGGRLSIGETKRGECFMLDPKTGRCKIYAVRPSQCSTYPFWGRFLASRHLWDRQHSKCPGINRGRLWTYEEIQNKMRRD
ncbi:MAG: YkgJ family cysteine cluster protein [Methanotrichaceae archaeon]